ncbi:MULTISPECIES: ABC transporter permease subunit [Metallosphaera]|uniref:ABC transporter permease subunit n=2 Tax=Sulfolobaceae TaxID=118883 RepID=UPI001F066F68|nr:ABC transporter permease subunit [Metallosphaera sedula]MCH1770460.1 ABC transporter permease subunit [Metallosphaera sedula]
MARKWSSQSLGIRSWGVRMRYSIPYLGYIVALGIVPFLYTFVYFGLNLSQSLTSLSTLPISEVFWNTVIYAGLTAIISALIGLILAVAVDILPRGKLIVSLLIMLPYTLPFTSAALVWSISLYANYGWFSYLFHLKFDPLNIPSLAIYGVTMVSIWSTIPLTFLITLTALRSIPSYVKENALLDNLSLSEYYGKIAVPMVGKAFWLAFLLAFLSALGNFDIPYALTEGGPGFATTTLPLLVYYEIIDLGNFSGGALVAALLSVMASIPAILILLISRSKRSGFISLSLRIPDRVFKPLMYVILGISLFFLVFPVYWMGLVAFRHSSLDFRSPPVIVPAGLTTKYFISTLDQSIPYIVSSVVVAVLASLLTIFVSFPSGYEISRGKGRWILPVSIYLYSLPSASYIIPLFIFFSSTNLMNTWWALIISTPIFTATYAVWLFHNNYLSFPRAYDDVAEVFQIKRRLLRVVMPLSRTSVFSVFLLSFILNWHLLFYPLILTQTPYNWSFPPEGAETVTVFALAQIYYRTINWALVASAALVAALPVMVVTIITLSRILKGDRSGGLKFI